MERSPVLPLPLTAMLLLPLTAMLLLPLTGQPQQTGQLWMPQQLRQVRKPWEP
ncbi:MAG: hypothetical protein M3R24_35910 [Chloroflexota bacterium]|nr:hypothetical protein [Chloroflexota bacterium]